VTAGPQAAQSQLLQRTIAALGRRHVGAVAGILDVAGGEPLIAGTGRLRAAGGPAPDADATFEIGSITKTFTALALAQAVVAGQLSLDTPVRDLLPAGTAVRDGVEITVEHLARHTSGLPRSPQRLGLRAVWAAGARAEDPYAPISTPVLLEQLSSTRSCCVGALVGVLGAQLLNANEPLLVDRATRWPIASALRSLSCPWRARQAA
jgi:serine-type D-Ala-D-Ala carboxypeptidase/endopeptidase